MIFGDVFLKKMSQPYIPFDEFRQRWPFEASEGVGGSLTPRISTWPNVAHQRKRADLMGPTFRVLVLRVASWNLRRLPTVQKVELLTPRRVKNRYFFWGTVVLILPMVNLFLKLGQTFRSICTVYTCLYFHSYWATDFGFRCSCFGFLVFSSATKARWFCSLVCNLIVRSLDVLGPLFWMIQHPANLKEIQLLSFFLGMGSSATCLSATLGIWQARKNSEHHGWTDDARLAIAGNFQ